MSPHLDPQEDDGAVETPTSFTLETDHIERMQRHDAEANLGRCVLEMHRCDPAHWDRVMPLPLVALIHDYNEKYES